MQNRTKTIKIRVLCVALLMSCIFCSCTRSENKNTDIVMPQKDQLWYEDQIDKLLDKGGTFIDNNGNSVLHYVAATENIDLAAALLRDYDLDINHKNEKGQTPLFWAVEQNRLHMLTFLLGRGADQNIADNYEMTVYDYAKEKGYESLRETMDMIVKQTVIENIALTIELEEIDNYKEWLYDDMFLLELKEEETEIISKTSSIGNETDAIELGVQLFNAHNKEKKSTDYHALTIYHDAEQNVWIFYYGMDMREAPMESGGVAYAIDGKDADLIQAWAEE